MVKPRVMSSSRGRFWVWVWVVLGAVGLGALLFGALPALEAYAANYVVTSTGDTIANDGFCTLREAIQEANNGADTDCPGSPSSGDDTITFSVSGTITLGSTLPSIVTASTVGKLTIDGSGQTITISGNNSVRVFVVDSGADLTLNHLTVIRGSTIFGGGGINNFEGRVTVSNSTFSENSAGSGGAIDNFNSTLTVNNSTFSNNSAQFGGAIDNSGSSTAIISRSTFSSNTAVNGGAIFNFNDTLTVSTSTFSGNSATSKGGAIFNGKTTTITNSTFVDNSANLGGAIFNELAIDVVILKNTIVANSPSGGNCSGSGAITDGGGNLSWPDTTCPGINQDPMLGLLQNNGGPTQTHALLAGSAAIDTAVLANCPATDQRGISRPQGGQCDIGVYEADPARTLTVQRTGSGSGTVTDNFAQINCGVTCASSYGHGAPVTLTATPDPGSTFAGWSGDADCSDGSVTMDADKTCTATFNLVPFTLGDVNDDGKINAIDARMAQQHADGVITLSGNQFLAADVDQDSDVDSVDATAIAKKGIGLPTGIPGFAWGPTRVVGARHAVPLQGWLFMVFTLPALLLVRRARRIATLLLAIGLAGALSQAVWSLPVCPRPAAPRSISLQPPCPTAPPAPSSWWCKGSRRTGAWRRCKGGSPSPMGWRSSR